MPPTSCDRYDTLAGKPMTLKWSDELDEAFTTAKEALTQATMLVHPHADKPTALTVGASGTAVMLYVMLCHSANRMPLRSDVSRPH